jgi:membrane-bound inhibitor of C-type lysozyme
VCCLPCTEISSFLLFATKRDVRRLSLDSTELADVVISLSNVSSAIGVEYDSDTDSIYWSDLDANIIGHAFWNGSNEEVKKRKNGCDRFQATRRNR